MTNLQNDRFGAWRRLLRELRAFDSWLRPALGELGEVAFAAALSFAAVAAGAEFLQPGFVVNYVSPRSIVAALVLSGALAVFGGRAATVRERHRPAYVISGVLCAISSFFASWYYFEPVPDMRLHMALAAVAVVAAVFWLPSAGREVEPEH